MWSLKQFYPEVLSFECFLAGDYSIVLPGLLCSLFFQTGFPAGEIRAG